MSPELFYLFLLPGLLWLAILFTLKNTAARLGVFLLAIASSLILNFKLLHPVDWGGLVFILYAVVELLLGSLLYLIIASIKNKKPILTLLLLTLLVGPGVYFYFTYFLKNKNQRATDRALWAATAQANDRSIEAAFLKCKTNLKDFDSNLVSICMRNSFVTVVKNQNDLNSCIETIKKAKNENTTLDVYTISESWRDCLYKFRVWTLPVQEKQNFCNQLPEAKDDCVMATGLFHEFSEPGECENHFANNHQHRSFCRYYLFGMGLKSRDQKRSFCTKMETKRPNTQFGSATQITRRETSLCLIAMAATSKDPELCNGLYYNHDQQSCNEAVERGVIR